MESMNDERLSYDRRRDPFQRKAMLERMKTSLGLAAEPQQTTGFWESFDESATLSRTNVFSLSKCIQ